MSVIPNGGIDFLRVWRTYIGNVSVRRTRVSSAVPYGKRYSGFVGGDIYDAPHGKSVCALSHTKYHVFDTGNARRSRMTYVIPTDNRIIIKSHNKKHVSTKHTHVLIFLYRII